MFLIFPRLPHFLPSISHVYFESWKANMKNYSLSLAQFPCSILFLLYFLTTISSSFSSNFSSSTQLCSHHQALSLLQFKQSFSIQRSPFWFARNYQNMINIPRQSHGKRVHTAACGMASLVTWKPGKWLNWTSLSACFMAPSILIAPSSPCIK